MSAADHIAKARRSLSSARHQLAGTFTEQAGREAYLAGYHAALALIVERSDKASKSHSGTRSEFARLARGDPRIGHEHVAFLGWAYELKSVADDGHDRSVTEAEAQKAIDHAERMVDLIAILVADAAP